MLKILQARCQQYMYWELPDVQAGLEKAEEPVIKLPTFIESWRKQGNSRKTSTFASWNSKPFDCVNHNKLWKILKELGTPDHLICLLRKLYGSQEAIVRTVHGTTDWFKLRKEYNRAVYCHPAYLTYMQSTSCGMPGCMNHKVESRLLGEISTTSDMQMIPLLWQKAKRN